MGLTLSCTGEDNVSAGAVPAASTRNTPLLRGIESQYTYTVYNLGPGLAVWRGEGLRKM
jgi:hypothetical protein